MKRKHVVVLVGSYYPNFSAVGICAKNVVDELKKEVDITVISQKTDVNEKDKEEYDGYTLVRISTFLDSLREKNLCGKRNIYKNTVLLSVRLLRYFQAVFCRINKKNDLVNAYIKKLIEVDQDKKIDATISCCFPFESVIAGAIYKRKFRKDIINIAYLFDLYANSSTLHRNYVNKKIKFKPHINFEWKLLNDYNNIIAMHSWNSHFIKYHKELFAKVDFMEHPLCIPKRNIVNKHIQSNKHKVVTYTGVLDQKIRNPQIALKYFDELLQTDKKIEIHFYILGNCNDKVNKLCLKYPQSVFNHGSVSSEIAHKAMENTDILLSIGNKGTGQTPSKLFEYISTGKPIIHFSKTCLDPAINILNKYPNSYIIAEYEKKEINSLNTFIRESISISDTSIIRKNFKDAFPENTANLILNTLYLK